MDDAFGRRVVVNKTIYVMIVLATVGVLTASNSLAQERVELTWYSGYPSGTPEAEIYEQYYRLYEQLNPQIRINDLGKDNTIDKLLALFISGTAPDIVKAGSPGIVSFYRQGLIEPVPKDIQARMRASVFPPSLQSITLSDGTMVGFPVESMVTGILYNRTMLLENGYAGPPATIQDLEGAARRLTRRSGTGEVVTPGFVIQAAGWVFNQFAISMFFADGGRILDEQGNLVMDGPALQQAVGRLASWLTSNDFFVRGNYLARFNRGEIAFSFGYPWMLSGLRQSFEGDINEHFGVIPVPGSAGYGSLHYGHAYGVNKASQHKEEAFKFLEWLSLAVIDDITPIGHVMAGMGSLPINRQDVRSKHYAADIDIYGDFLRVLEYGRTNSTWEQYGASPNFFAAFKDVIDGHGHPAGVVDKLLTQVRTDMEKYAGYLNVK